ncbi:HepT-like ribonuclease domain-containing protein [Methanocaldococcus sp.]
MSKRDVKAFLYDILESANDVIEFTKNIDYNEFISNKMVRYAVIRALEIIGEASRYISKDFREEYPNVPWKEMVGLRNIPIHKYFISFFGR